MEKRLEDIMNYLKNKKEISTRSFLKKSDFFGASPITLRRDLHKLENKGLIKLTYGYINVSGLFDFSDKNTSDHVSKNRIEQKVNMAKIANNLLKDNEIIFVNTGTTCEEFIGVIDKKVKLLATNSLPVIAKAIKNKNIDNLLFIGGIVDKTKNACISNINYDFLNDIYFDRLFTSCGSIKNDSGIFFDTIDESKLINRLVKNSAFNCLFVEDYKVEKLSLVKTFTKDIFDEIIYYDLNKTVVE